MNILITGTTSGIGHELAVQYLSRNHRVICCGRNADALQKLQVDFPGLASTRCFDITDPAETLQQLADSGPLDLAILNAGTCEYLDMPNFDAKAFARVIETNLIGVANCLEPLIPQLTEGSRLAIIGSSASYLPLPRAEAYGASKAALEYLSKTLAITLKPSNIKVTYIAPGFVKTPLTDRNDFPMPMRLNVSDAAQCIIAGLARGKAEIHFPKRFTALLKFVGMMPFALQKQVIGRLVAR